MSIAIEEVDQKEEIQKELLYKEILITNEQINKID